MNQLGILISSSLLIALLNLAACTPAGSTGADPSASKPSPSVDVHESVCGSGAPLELQPNAEGLYDLVQIPPRTDEFCALILPIDSQAFYGFVMGTASVDYRRTLPLDRFSHVLFFNTRTLELAAIAEVSNSLAGTPEDVSSLTWEQSGHSFENAVDYFGGRRYGFAIELKNIQPLPKPISLADAHAMDPKFARPYGYLFLDRHPVINTAVRQQLGL